MSDFVIEWPTCIGSEFVISAVDNWIVAQKLKCTMRAPLVKFSGSTHWHIQQPGVSGTLEITVWPQAHKFWASIRSNRYADWMENAMADLSGLVDQGVTPPAHIVSVNGTTEELMKLARSAALAAYVPYSKFRVGAAVRTEIGVFSGCNVENASYGLCICAERNAIFCAIASGARVFTGIAVSCIDANLITGTQSRMPCGACRQVMSEFLLSTSVIEVDGVGTMSIEQLLPVAFKLDNV